MSDSKYSDPSSVPPTEFHPRKPGSGPMTHHGHKPGVDASPADRAPEFHAQTLPEGSAPADKTFEPQASEIPSQANNEDAVGNEDDDDATTSAADTLGGATSADVHTGLGHPGQGQTSTELRHDGSRGGKKEKQGLAGKTTAYASNRQADPRGDQTHRALDEDAPPGRGDKGALGAEDIPPETA